MKKLLFLTALIAFLFVLCAKAFCSDTCISISRAYISSSGVVTVTGVINNYSEDQSLIAMISKSSGGQYTVSDSSGESAIIFFDQISPEISEDNLFTLTLKTALAIDESQEYTVRLGGDGIASVQSVLLGYEIYYGDIDGDYIITAGDAAVVLAYVLDKSSVYLTQDQINRAKVSGLSSLSAADVSCILNKALDCSYKFPVES